MKRLNFLKLGLSLLLATMILSACGSVSPTAVPTPAGASTPATTSKVALDDSILQVINEATKSGDYQEPQDSIPDADFTNIYFTAKATSGGTGVFRVPTKGGAATAVFTGKPFENVRGISLSPDGKQLFVTDTSAGGKGQIFTLPTAGGTPNVLNGSVGTAPQNITVMKQGGQLQIYFTGKDPVSGQPAVFKLAGAGAATATVLFKGAPLVEPDGVVVTGAGTVYVADRAAAGNGFGKVFKLEGEKQSVVVEKVRTGNPAGITLTIDDGLLLVSALDPEKPNNQVLIVELASGRTGVLTKVVSQNSAGGGLHVMASRKANNFSWSDRRGGGGGKVYGLQQVGS